MITDLYSIENICTHVYEIIQVQGAFTEPFEALFWRQEKLIAMWSAQSPRRMRNCRKRSAKRFRCRCNGDVGIKKPGDSGGNGLVMGETKP